MTGPRRPWRARVAGMSLVLAMAAGTAACGGGAGAGPSAPPGLHTNLAVPASVADLPLVDQAGHATDLAAFRGRVLVLAPFLTSCQEECPLTTGAFLAIQRDLKAAGLAGQVTVAELSIDPGRDTPARLAAYASYTGADWTLLTGSAADLAAFWRHFGVYYEKVPEDNPPGIDWQTGKPYTYDVNHMNGFLVFDRAGHQRFLTADLPDLHGKLPADLRRLLNASGLANLTRPGQQSWTVPQALAVIGQVLGRPVPVAGG